MSSSPKLVKRKATRKRTAPKAPESAASPLAPVETDAAAGDLPGRLQQLADAAAARPGIVGAALLLTSPTGRYRAVAVSGTSPIPVGALVSREGDTLGWGEDSGQATLDLLPAVGSAGEACDAAAVPMALYERALGTLVVFAPGLERKRVDAGLPALREIAATGASAAAAARVHSLESHLIEVNSIVEVGQVLTGLLDMEDVLSYVVYLAESLVAGHNTTVSLVAEDGAHLVLRNSTGSLRASEGRSIPVEGSLMGWVVTNGEAVTCASLAEDPRGFPWEDRYGPAVVVPLTSNGKIIGTFMVTRVEGADLFTEENIVILRTMASYATIAITNAEIHRKQQEVATTLRRQAAELEQAYDELHRSQDQLLISEKMAALGRVTAGIAHEINSPLAGILNSLRTARAYVEEYRTSAGDPEITVDDHQGIADDILSALTVADGAVQKVAQFVKTIKGQTRIGDGTKRAFDPAVEVDATVSLLQHETRRRRVAVFTEMERGHRLLGDPGKFGLVVQNLVSNAMDAFQDEAGEIWIRIAEEGDRLRVAVEDKGCGIPEEIRGRIFDYLFTTKAVGRGTGLGLAMVHSVVTSDFGGTIELDSEPGVGTTFTLRFPVPPPETDHGA